jgi:protoporphyrinogen oxidase
MTSGSNGVEASHRAFAPVETSIEFRSSKLPIVVIGAGPAGLAAALELTRAGESCVVLEADSEYVGGIARTVNYKGYRLDIGGHRFYTKLDEINDWWNELLPDDFIEVKRASRIYYKKRFLEYPLRAWDAFSKMGLLFSVRAVLSHLYRKARPIPNEVSFRDWVVNRFGDRLFETFFESYTEKVWGMKCTEISADWAAQRIQGLSLKDVLVRALIPNFGRQNDPAFKTLIDTFHYPRLGCGMLWERARDRVIEGGNSVVMDRTVVGLATTGDRVTQVECVDSAGHRYTFPCRGVISSMPLRELIESFDAAPDNVIAAARKLRYRDFLTVGLKVEKRHLFTDNWIYVHDPDVKIGRVQNFKNWSPEMVPDPNVSFVGLEYFCFEGDDLWTTDDADLIALGKAEFERIGLAKQSDITDATVVRMPKAYPIYDADYREAVATIRTWLRGLENIWSSGRNGMHQYNNQDHSIMSALVSARNLLGTDRRDPWMISHDAEYLEERAVPTAVQ